MIMDLENNIGSKPRSELWRQEHDAENNLDIIGAPGRSEVCPQKNLGRDKVSHDDVLDCRITEDGYRTFRMLTYCVVYLAVLCSPIVALAAAFYGWKVIEIVLTR